MLKRKKISFTGLLIIVVIMSIGAIVQAGGIA